MYDATTTAEDIDHDFTNHAPLDPSVVEAFEDIRTYAKALGVRILEVVPPCDERSEALTHLRQALMWAIGGIACYQGNFMPESGVRLGDILEGREGAPPDGDLADGPFDGASDLESKAQQALVGGVDLEPGSSVSEGEDGHG